MAMHQEECCGCLGGESKEGEEMRGQACTATGTKSVTIGGALELQPGGGESYNRQEWIRSGLRATAGHRSMSGCYAADRWEDEEGLDQRAARGENIPSTRFFKNPVSARRSVMLLASAAVGTALLPGSCAVPSIKLPSPPQLHPMGGAGGLKSWDVASVFEPAGRLISDVHESLKAVNSLVEAKRVELRKWDENALGFERALTQEQTWIHPLQGWHRMQHVVDKESGSEASKPTLWPAKCGMIAKEALSVAPHIGDITSMFHRGDDDEDYAALQQDVKWVNDQLLRDALQLVDEGGWEETGKPVNGVHVWRKHVSAERRFAGIRTGKASQFVCIKATGVVGVPPDAVFELFKDNDKAKEYNEYCKEVRDLEWIDQKTKITYSETGQPWSRDFVTRNYYHGDDPVSGAKIIVSRGEEHALAPRKKGVTRMDLTIGANILKPTPDGKTELTVLTHVNPGGLANSQFGAMVTNRLSAESPRAFILKFNEVATGKGPAASKKPRRGTALVQKIKAGGGKGGRVVRKGTQAVAGLVSTGFGKGLGGIRAVGGKVKSGLSKLRPRGRKQHQVVDSQQSGDQQMAAAPA